jgi:hypothetical protein
MVVLLQGGGGSQGIRMTSQDSNVVCKGAYSNDLDI